MKLNTPLGRVLFALSTCLALGITIAVWTQFDGTSPWFKMLFSVVTVGILVRNAQLAFSAPGAPSAPDGAPGARG